MTKSLGILTNLANQGSKEAFYILGNYYFLHLKEFKKGFEFYEKSSELGYDLAQYTLGSNYLTGVNIKTDIKQGIYWLNLSAKQGNIDAIIALGFEYFYGTRIEKDVHLGIFYLEKGAEKEKVECINTLSNAYFSGDDIPQDLEKSLSICLKYEYLKIPKCLCRTGIHYYFGFGCEKNIPLSLYYLEESAEFEEQLAQITLAIHYFEEGDYEKSVKWMCRTEKNGMPVKYELLYDDIFLSDKSHQKFIEFIKDLQISTSITNIQLGLSYWNGYLVEKNLKKSFEYFQKAQDSNDPICNYYLGLFYKIGDVIPQNYQKSLNFFESSFSETTSENLKLLIKKEMSFCKKKIKNNTEIIEYLDKGRYGSVYLAKINNKEVAVKLVECFDLESANKALKEYQIVYKLKHLNIYKVYYSSIDLKNNNLIVKLEMKYYPLGSFEKYINGFALVDERMVKEWSIQILNGISYIHSLGLVHRDLKPSNILVDKIDDKITLLLSDFGESKYSMNTMDSIVGTEHYIAPEIIQQKSYNHTIDVFAFGGILLYMISRKKLVLYKEILNENYEYKVYEMIEKQGFLKFFAKIIIDCTNLIPKNRPSIKELLDLFSIPFCK